MIFLKNLFSRKETILLHTCCGGCGVYTIKLLKKQYKVISYYYNPGIFPEKEYKARCVDAKKVAKKYHIKFIVGKYDNKEWENRVKGYENEKEGGKRCEICFHDRLLETAKKARELKIKVFTTTLSISPHKNSKVINNIGERLSSEYGLSFLSRNFKEKDGFKKSVELSKKLNLYRQNYCGCKYSIRK